MSSISRQIGFRHDNPRRARGEAAYRAGTVGFVRVDSGTIEAQCLRLLEALASTDKPNPRFNTPQLPDNLTRMAAMQGIKIRTEKTATGKWRVFRDGFLDDGLKFPEFIRKPIGNAIKKLTVTCVEDPNGDWSMRVGRDGGLWWNTSSVGNLDDDSRNMRTLEHLLHVNNDFATQQVV